MMNTREFFATIAIIAIIVITVVTVVVAFALPARYERARACEDRGGEYVESSRGMVCVEVLR